MNINMMKLIFFYYWRICLLKESPENTPYSLFLMGLSAILLALILIVQWQFSDSVFANDFSTTLIAASSLILSYILYTYALLFFRGVRSRLVQTLTCLFATRIIIHILASPLLLLDPYLSHVHLKNPIFLFIGVIYLFITLGLSVWQFVITAHIYKYALNTSAIQSVLAAFGVLAVNILTVSLWR
jgi:hypothetical protein